MAVLKNSIRINATPEKLFNTLIDIFSSKESFKAWHKDHVKCQWLKGKPFEIGSVLYVEEYLHEKLHKLKFVSVQLEPNIKIEYKLLFPASIVCPKGSFSIEPKGEDCVFTATLSFRMDWILSIFSKYRVEAIKIHMKEEGENLKMILENGGI